MKLLFSILVLLMSSFSLAEGDPSQTEHLAEGLAW